ncbi:probable sugar phosphate/phosphate translocator At1g06470 [Helianthus annuus]|uniref:probable sugar phosphate/phosphate translocator At1g06470 n=1 Tax=Helianthus annuus TaxID=4232 RepID=UPI000B8F24A1|nr:probable sugar phosphate/phosphate translocator At1g06470 [Helianthus annuus]
MKMRNRKLGWEKGILPFTVVPTAFAKALDINLSNASLVFISVAFATMCKSASPIFLLIFAFAFRRFTPGCRSYVGSVKFIWKENHY